MSFHSVSEFHSLKTRLGERLQEATSLYAHENTLLPLNRAALHQMSTDLDHTAGELLMFGCDVWPESARGDENDMTVETTPSETDPPRLSAALFWSIVALGVTLPVSALLYHFIGGGNYWAITFGIVTIAMLFGSVHGLLHTGISYSLNNFFVIGSPLAFSQPTKIEIGMAIGSITLAVVLPWLARHAPTWRVALPSPAWHRTK